MVVPFAEGRNPDSEKARKLFAGYERFDKRVCNLNSGWSEDIGFTHGWHFVFNSASDR